MEHEGSALILQNFCGFAALSLVCIETLLASKWLSSTSNRRTGFKQVFYSHLRTIKVTSAGAWYLIGARVSPSPLLMLTSIDPTL